MKVEIRDKQIHILLEGRIDASNAADVEKEVMNVISDNPGLPVIFDAEKLDYISSAGLRVMLKAHKTTKGSLSVINVSRDVYDIFETTGFTDILDIQKAYRQMSIEGCEVVGEGFIGTVYRTDPETIVKVYKCDNPVPKIKNEQKMAKLALVSGIPTAISYDIVKVGDSYGSVFELFNSSTLNDIVKNNEKPFEEVVEQYAKLIKEVHETELDNDEIPSAKGIFEGYVKLQEEYIGKENADRILKFIDTIPDSKGAIHSDLQMKNVMIVDGEMMLIDMDGLSTGDPVYDLQALYVTYKMFKEDEPDNTMNFLGLSAEICDQVWDRVFALYYADKNEEEKAEIFDKLFLLACVRFMNLVTNSALKEGELGRTRIMHTKEHIEDILDKLGF